MRDGDRANKNEIEIFVFSVTSNDFPHDMLLYRLYGGVTLVEYAMKPEAEPGLRTETNA